MRCLCALDIISFKTATLDCGRICRLPGRLVAVDVVMNCLPALNILKWVCVSVSLLVCQGSTLCTRITLEGHVPCTSSSVVGVAFGVPEKIMVLAAAREVVNARLATRSVQLPFGWTRAARAIDPAPRRPR